MFQSRNRKKMKIIKAPKYNRNVFKTHLTVHNKLALPNQVRLKMLPRIQNLGTQGQKIWKANYGFLNSPKKRTKLTILSKEDAQDSEFHSFWENPGDHKLLSRFTDLQ